MRKAKKRMKERNAQREKMKKMRETSVADDEEEEGGGLMGAMAGGVTGGIGAVSGGPSPLSLPRAAVCDVSNWAACRGACFGVLLFGGRRPLPR